MTDDRQPSCEERIAEALESRLDDVRELLEGLKAEDDETREEAHERASYYGLGLDVKRVITWQLSTGGPGDELRFTVDEDGSVVRIEYVFLDWWDGATRDVTGDAFDTLEEFYEYEIRPFVECQ